MTRHETGGCLYNGVSQRYDPPSPLVSAFCLRILNVDGVMIFYHGIVQLTFVKTQCL